MVKSMENNLERIQQKLIKRNEQPKEKKLSALDKYVIFSFTCLIVFTVVIICVQTITGMTQDTLTTCFFSAFGGELLLCAMIKRLKLKKEDE